MNYWMLLTNSGSTDGAFNALRPFRIGLSDGAVSIGNNTLNVLHGGNVGIGMSATERLDVNGNIRASGTFIGNGSTITNLNASNLTS